MLQGASKQAQKLYKLWYQQQQCYVHWATRLLFSSLTAYQLQTITCEPSKDTANPPVARGFSPGLSSGFPGEGKVMKKPQTSPPAGLSGHMRRLIIICFFSLSVLLAIILKYQLLINLLKA